MISHPGGFARDVLKGLTGGQGLPLAGAFSGFVLLKSFTWNGLSYELVFFLLIYVQITVLVERAMRRYGR